MEPSIMPTVSCYSVEELDFSLLPGLHWKRRRKIYNDYLKSDHWNTRRQQLIELAGARCQICGKKTRPLIVHHKHYKSLGYEKPKDCLVLCRKCHKRKHQKPINGATFRQRPRWNPKKPGKATRRLKHQCIACETWQRKPLRRCDFCGAGGFCLNCLMSKHARVCLATVPEISG